MTLLTEFIPFLQKLSNLINDQKKAENIRKIIESIRLRRFSSAQEQRVSNQISQLRMRTNPLSLNYQQDEVICISDDEDMDEQRLSSTIDQRNAPPLLEPRVVLNRLDTNIHLPLNQPVNSPVSKRSRTLNSLHESNHKSSIESDESSESGKSTSPEINKKKRTRLNYSSSDEIIRKIKSNKMRRIDSEESSCNEPVNDGSDRSSYTSKGSSNAKYSANLDTLRTLIRKYAEKCNTLNECTIEYSLRGDIGKNDFSKLETLLKKCLKAKILTDECYKQASKRENLLKLFIRETVARNTKSLRNRIIAADVSELSNSEESSTSSNEDKDDNDEDFQKSYFSYHSNEEVAYKPEKSKRHATVSKQRTKPKKVRSSEKDKLMRDINASYMRKDFFELKPRQHKKVNYKLTDESDSEIDNLHLQNIRSKKIKTPCRQRKRIRNISDSSDSAKNLKNDRATSDSLINGLVSQAKRVEDDDRTTPDINVTTHPRVHILDLQIRRENDEEIDTDCSSGETIFNMENKKDNNFSSSDEDDYGDKPKYHFIKKEKVMSCRAMLQRMELIEGKTYKVSHVNDAWKVNEDNQNLIDEISTNYSSSEASVNSSGLHNILDENHKKSNEVGFVENVETLEKNNSNPQKEHEENKSAEGEIQIQPHRACVNHNGKLQIQSKLDQNENNLENNNTFDDDLIRSNDEIIEEVKRPRLSRSSSLEIIDKSIEIINLDNSEDLASKENHEGIPTKPEKVFLARGDAEHNFDLNNESSAQNKSENTSVNENILPPMVTIPDKVIDKFKKNESSSLHKQTPNTKNFSSPKNLSSTQFAQKKIALTVTLHYQISNLSYTGCRRGILYKCHVASCKFSSFLEDDIRKHLNEKHIDVKWTGYCNLCAINVTEKVSGLLDELDHMVDCHITKYLQETVPANKNAKDIENSTREENTNFNSSNNYCHNEVPTFSLTLPSQSIELPHKTTDNEKPSRSSSLSTPPPIITETNRITSTNILSTILQGERSENNLLKNQDQNKKDEPISNSNERNQEKSNISFLRIKRLPGDLLSTLPKDNQEFLTSTQQKNVENIVPSSSASQSNTTTTLFCESLLYNKFPLTHCQPLTIHNPTKTTKDQIMNNCNIFLDSLQNKPIFNISIKDSIKSTPHPIATITSSVKEVSNLLENHFDGNNPMNTLSANNQLVFITNKFRPWSNSVDLKFGSLIKSMLTIENLRKLYKCMFTNCDFCSNNENDFHKHLLYHQDISKNFELLCCYCKFKTKNAVLLMDHYKETYMNCKYFCHQCFYRTPSFYKIVEHVKLHQPVSSYDTIDSIIESQFEEKEFHSLKLLSLRKIKCTRCMQVFSTVLHFKQHWLKDHSDFPFFCGFCKKSVSIETSYQHLARCYRIFNYHCCYCLFGCQVLREMSSHVISNHIDKAPFYIERCDITHIDSPASIKAACVRKFS